MDFFTKMFQELEAESPSKKSDLQVRLESEGWTLASNHSLVSRIHPEARLALSTDGELYDYYKNAVGYGEVLITQAHNRFGEPMPETCRAVYVKGEPKKFEVGV